MLYTLADHNATVIALTDAIGRVVTQYGYTPYGDLLAAEPKDHAVLIMDQTGWPRAKALRVPRNIWILYLPPYSPELNPVERLWGYLRSHDLANRVFDDYQHLLDAGADAWRELTHELLQSVCACDYIPRAEMEGSVSRGSSLSVPS